MVYQRIARCELWVYHINADGYLWDRVHQRSKPFTTKAPTCGSRKTSTLTCIHMVVGRLPSVPFLLVSSPNFYILQTKHGSTFLFSRFRPIQQHRTYYIEKEGHQMNQQPKFVWLFSFSVTRPSQPINTFSARVEDRQGIGAGFTTKKRRYEWSTINGHNMPSSVSIYTIKV